MPPPVYGCHTPTDSCTGSQALLLRTPYNRYLRRQGASPCLLLRGLLLGRGLSPTRRSNSFLFYAGKHLFFPFAKEKKVHTLRKPQRNPHKTKKGAAPSAPDPPCLRAFAGRLALPGRGLRGVAAPLGAGRASPAGRGHCAEGAGEPLSGVRCGPPLGPGGRAACPGRSPPVRRVWDLSRCAHPRRGEVPGAAQQNPRLQGSASRARPKPCSRATPRCPRQARSPPPPPYTRPLRPGSGCRAEAARSGHRVRPARRTGGRGPAPAPSPRSRRWDSPQPLFPEAGKRWQRSLVSSSVRQSVVQGSGRQSELSSVQGLPLADRRALPMAPKSDGDWPAGRLFVVNGAISLSDFLAGRKVHLELCCKHELSLPTEGPLQARLPVLFGLA